DFELSVNLSGLIDREAENKRLEKEQAKAQSAIVAKRNKLANEKFVSGAPAEIVAREREGLQQLEEQLQATEKALTDLRSA
ncbi:MAG TPA: hypothetical protein PKD54_16010, partial [Pirellulaceae bacterium]|nr:hypothetical protein [Pirellulaceae bacterium]